MTYELFAGINDDYEFPPEVRAALAASSELKYQTLALTTTQRNNLSGDDLWDGRVITNITTDRLNRYDAGLAEWVAVADEQDTHPQIVANAAARDAITSPYLGKHVVLNDTKVEYVWDGSIWRATARGGPDITVQIAKAFTIGSAALRVAYLGDKMIAVSGIIPVTTPDSGNFRLYVYSGLPLPVNSYTSIPAWYRFTSNNTVHNFNFHEDGGMWVAVPNGGTAAAGWTNAAGTNDSVCINAVYKIA